MSKIRILAVEDDPIFAETIELLMEELDYELIGVVDSDREALRMHRATNPDLVLMDIDINGEMDGVQVAQKMNEEYPTPIIFVTSHRDKETFEKAKNTHPYAYVSKPLDEINLQYALEIAVGRISLLDNSEPPQENSGTSSFSWGQDVLFNGSIFVKTDNKLRKINFEDILWVEVDKKLIGIKTKKENLILRCPLKEIERKLPPDSFMRVHRAYIINTKEVEDIDLADNSIVIKGIPIPMGVTYRDQLLKHLNMLG